MPAALEGEALWCAQRVAFIGSKHPAGGRRNLQRPGMIPARRLGGPPNHATSYRSVLPGPRKGPLTRFSGPPARHRETGCVSRHSSHLLNCLTWVGFCSLLGCEWERTAPLRSHRAQHLPSSLTSDHRTVAGAQTERAFSRWQVFIKLSSLLFKHRSSFDYLLSLQSVSQIKVQLIELWIYVCTCNFSLIAFMFLQ